MLPFNPVTDDLSSIAPLVSLGSADIVSVALPRRQQFYYLLKAVRYIFYTACIIVSITSASYAQGNGACPCTIFQPSDKPEFPLINDGAAIEAGMKFQSTIDGFVTGAKYYKGLGTTGEHLAHLWSNTGVMLAEGSFLNETDSGWQTVLFTAPIAVKAGTTYIISYHSSSGQYAATNPYFSAAVTNGPLRALANDEDGKNGVYTYGDQPGFPVSNFQSANYWVDVIFDPFAGPNSAPVITDVVATPDADGSVTITWKTNKVADSRVDCYGMDNSTINQVNNAPGFVINHSITLTGLYARTIYYYRVTSATASHRSTTDPTPPNTYSFKSPDQVCSQDQLAIDFSSGTVSSNLFVSTRSDGEVILKPSIASTEFSTLPAPAMWNGFLWTGSGYFKVSGEKLLVEGARYNSEPAGASFVPGSSIEFSAIFDSATSQHIGFGGGTDTTGVDGIYYGENPWAMFSTGNSTPQLTVRTFDGTHFNDVVIPGNYIGSVHIYRIEWTTAGGFNYYIDDVLVHAETGITITSAMRPAMSDYVADGKPLTIDWIHLSPYSTETGVFVSRVFDGGVSKDWGAAYWSANIPDGTTLQLLQRKGNTPVPDASWTDFTSIASSGTSISGTSRYIQYKAMFNSGNAARTPVLKSFVITCANTLQIPLPGTLNLKAIAKGPNADLQWTSSSDQNNKGFEIQRGLDSTSWSSIGFVNSQAGGSYQYSDKNLAVATYYYRIRQEGTDGTSIYSGIVAVTISDHFAQQLFQNHPNPFISTTTIEFVVAQSAHVRLTLYDQMGRKVKQLMDESKAPGYYQVQVNRNGLGAGLYYYKLDVDDQSLIKKMMIQ